MSFCDALGVIACVVDSACRVHISAYKPPVSINSAWLPVCCTCPSYRHQSCISRPQFAVWDKTWYDMTLHKSCSGNRHFKILHRSLGYQIWHSKIKDAVDAIGTNSMMRTILPGCNMSKNDSITMWFKNAQTTTTKHCGSKLTFITTIVSASLIVERRCATMSLLQGDCVRALWICCSVMLSRALVASCIQYDN